MDNPCSNNGNSSNSTEEFSEEIEKEIQKRRENLKRKEGERKSMRGQTQERRSEQSDRNIGLPEKYNAANFFAIVFSGFCVLVLFATDVKHENPTSFWWQIGFWGFVLITGLVALFNPTETKPIDDGTFELSQNGFKVELENKVYECRWTDISTLIGYKMDLFAVDQICVDVFTDEGEGFTITEDTEGWNQFLKHSKENLNEIPENWLKKIAYPPFESNSTLLYDKKNRTKDEVIEEVYEKE